MSDNPRLIHAEPTKDLFIYMLVRDIPLIRAIIDLVDNSVDGATHLQSNENYEGLWIKILVNKEYFQIQDNCGGITVNDAEEYAFKFGRPNDAELDLTGKNIGNLYKRIINNQLKQSVSNANSAGSEDEKLNYKHIFDFRYADGCRILTVGWLFFEQNYCNVAEQCKFSKNFHATELDSSYEINVPNLTPKEIQYLDSQMPTDDCDAGKGICIPSKDVKSYAELYKYFPSFVEMLM
ncbi:O-methyltransferase [Nostoc sp.]|uniref:O-methyltransferase n=1 Tax=Nostoc sp. TaxID=1180 RepID=UPI002FF5F641